MNGRHDGRSAPAQARPPQPQGPRSTPSVGQIARSYERPRDPLAFLVGKRVVVGLASWGAVDCVRDGEPAPIFNVLTAVSPAEEGAPIYSIRALTGSSMNATRRLEGRLVSVETYVLVVDRACTSDEVAAGELGKPHLVVVFKHAVATLEEARP